MNNKNVKYNKDNNRLNLKNFHMTTIIALNCSNGIVIASDSQVTAGDIKRSQEDKIYKTKVDENIDIVMAGSGINAYISRFIDYFELHKKDKKIKILRDFADRSEDMIRRLMRRYPEMKLAIMAAIRFKENTNISWDLYAFYSPGVADKIKTYECIGSGSTIAEYILSRLWFEKLTVEQGLRIAIYVIDEVKKTDTYSGGLTRVTKITNEGIISMNPLEIIEISSIAQRSDYESRGIWARTILFPEKIKKENDKPKEIQKNN